MVELSAKEQKFLDRLREGNINIPRLKTRLSMAMLICYLLWSGIFLSAVVVVLVLGERPQFYHMLFLLSIICVSAGMYVNVRYTFNVISRAGEDQGR